MEKIKKIMFRWWFYWFGWGYVMPGRKQKLTPKMIEHGKYLARKYPPLQDKEDKTL